jgi:hypothetical protein
MSKKKNCIIVAPHVDDELIGNFEILNDLDNKITIVYGADAPAERRKEASKLRESFPNVMHQVYHSSFPLAYLSANPTLYFPDPINEFHPAHRAWGFAGEALARDGANVVFYTTMMNVPYIHEVSDSMKKETLLDRIYSSQKSLWEYEKKYILFEGRTKWIF